MPAAHEKLVRTLSNEPSPPSTGGVSSPSLVISVHAIGGFACVTPSLPPRAALSTRYETRPVARNGFNAPFNATVHCVAAEPLEVVLRVGVIDGEREVAHGCVVLGAMRGGYRVLHLCDNKGTRIDLCGLLLRIEHGVQPAEKLSAAFASEQAQRDGVATALNVPRRGWRGGSKHDRFAASPRRST